MTLRCWEGNELRTHTTWWPGQSSVDLRPATAGAIRMMRATGTWAGGAWEEAGMGGCGSHDACAPGVFVVSNENHAQGSVWPKSLWLKAEVEKLLERQSETPSVKDAWPKDA